MTGDGPLGYYLHKVTGRKWFNADTEMEAGCGIVPITYKDKSLVHALQWAIGLEWYLLVKDPWRVAMSTDHPNGGSFLAYPQIIHLLMDRTYRAGDAEDASTRACCERSTLTDLDREYTLNEIAIITRAGPARILGLKHKGHLGAGRRRRRHDLHAARRTRGDVRAAALRHQGRASVVEQGEIRDRALRQDAARRPGLRPRRRSSTSGSGSSSSIRSASATIRSAASICTRPNKSPAANKARP